MVANEAKQKKIASTKFQPSNHQKTRAPPQRYRKRRVKESGMGTPVDTLRFKIKTKENKIKIPEIRSGRKIKGPQDRDLP